MRKVKIKLILQSISSLVTTFGADSSVVREILSYRKHTDRAQDHLHTFTLAAGIASARSDIPTLNPIDMRALPRGESVFKSVYELYDSVSDPDLSGSYYIHLPQSVSLYYKKAFVGSLSKVYIPHGAADPWVHTSGMVVIPPVAVKINNMVSTCKIMRDMPRNSYVKSVLRCVDALALEATGKSGAVTKSMFAVNYPHAVRGKAVCSERVKPFNVAIPYHMAKTLGVEPGHLVLGLRYPDLGTSSWVVCRVQEVISDRMYSRCIVVGENSWTSTNLDFDGDTIYLMSLKRRESHADLRRVFEARDTRNEIITRLNSSKAFPTEKRGMTIENADFTERRPDNLEEYLLAVQGLNAVKLRTAPTVGYLYGVYRVMEEELGFEREWRISWEETFRRIAQMSIGAKHGILPVFTTFKDAVESIDLESSQEALRELGIDSKSLRFVKHAVTKACKEVNGTLPSKTNVSVIGSIIQARHNTWRITRQKMRAAQLVDAVKRRKHDKVDISYIIEKSERTSAQSARAIAQATTNR